MQEVEQDFEGNYCFRMNVSLLWSCAVQYTFLNPVYIQYQSRTLSAKTLISNVIRIENGELLHSVVHQVVRIRANNDTINMNILTM